MLKKTITYKDYDGVERTEDFYFNLSKTELSEMQLSQEGGLDNLIRKISQEQNIPELLKVFKQIVAKAYGVKSADGKHFRKSKEIFENFESTVAYDELFFEFISKPDIAAAFIKGIIPADIAEQAEAIVKEKTAN